MKLLATIYRQRFTRIVQQLLLAFCVLLSGWSADAAPSIDRAGKIEITAKATTTSHRLPVRANVPNKSPQKSEVSAADGPVAMAAGPKTMLLAGPDSDGDGIANDVDLDDDNDGILDSAECKSYTVYLREPVFTGYSTNVPVVITGGNGPVNFSWNQQIAPAGLTYAGVTWTRAAANVIPDATGKITVSMVVSSTVPGSYVGIDGALITDGTSYTVLDDPQFTYTGNWNILTNAGNGLYNGTQRRVDAPFAGQTATATFAGLMTACDTDGDGIANSLDLDSDGDGCPDAIEGGAAFTTSNLVSSTMAGGSTNINTNLGTSVGSTTATLGVPTIAGTGQGVGISQASAFNACFDSDGDGIGDIDDLDDDNDGILDVAECPTVFNSTSVSIANGNPTSGTVAGTTNGLQFDITSLDNSFRLFINGTPITSQEIQFIPTLPASYSFVQNVQFADGSVYGNQVGNIWTLGTSNVATPLVRVVISSSGAVSLFGSKILNGPLFPLVLTNGATFNNVTITNTNSFSITQSVWVATYLTGVLGSVANGTCDTDGDGVVNRLDLDSDGDGCPDAIEGGGTFKVADLVSSTMAGGSTNESRNLGTNVSSATATYGVPTIAGAGQTIGTSQSATAQDADCPPPCSATLAPALSATTVTNACPQTTINLGSVTTTNNPASLSLTWHTGTPATATNRITSVSAVAPGTYYAAFFDATANCYSGTAVTPVTATTVACCPSPTLGGSLTLVGTLPLCSVSNQGVLLLSGQTGSVVKWQTSTNGGLNWTDIPGTAGLTQYSFANAQNNQQYRAVVNNGAGCSDAFSSVISTPTSASACSADCDVKPGSIIK